MFNTTTSGGAGQRDRWLSRLRVLALALPVLTAAFSALAQSDNDPDAVHTSTTREPTSTYDVRKLARTMTIDKVVILDHGSEATNVLALTPLENAESVFRTHQSVTMSMSLGGMAMPAQEVPDSITVIHNRVDKILPDGSFQLTATVRSAAVDPDAGTDPAATRALNKRLSGMVGATETFRMQLDGTILEHPEAAGGGDDTSDDAEMGEDRGASRREQVRAELNTQMMSDLLQLPSEPIGTGAVWRRKFVMELNGLTAIAIATGTLVDADETSLEIEHNAVMMIVSQMLDGNLTPPGSMVTVTEGFGTSRGRVIIDRRTGCPLSGSMTTTFDAALMMSVRDISQNMEQRMTVVMEYSTPE